MNKILVIEDDPAIQRGLKDALEQDNFAVELESDGEQGYKRALSESYDLLILDLMLPTMNGQNICRELRRQRITVPILMLTSRSDEIDKVIGFEIGADDYVTKPFSVVELLARIRALIRRAQISAQSVAVYTFANITIDFNKHEARKDQQLLNLSVKEFDVLRFLVGHESELITRDRLLNEVWGYDIFPTTRTVDNTIFNLRKKIEDDPANPKYLVTVHGAGYKFTRPQ
jgi:DNA-binding response OmpR family regulator